MARREAKRVFPAAIDGFAFYCMCDVDSGGWVCGRVLATYVLVLEETQHFQLPKDTLR